MLNPAIGRFLSEDPLGLQPGETNLYTYCENNPVNIVDPSGLAEYRLGPNKETLTERYSTLPNDKHADQFWYDITRGPEQLLSMNERKPGPGQWTSKKMVEWDTRTGRKTVEIIWYPFDAEALETFDRIKHRLWVRETESRLTVQLGAYSVPVSELEEELDSTVWLVDGGPVGRTYVQDLPIHGENFQLVYGPAPRPGDAGEPHMRVVGAKRETAGFGTAVYTAEELWFNYKRNALREAAEATAVDATLAVIGEVVLAKIPRPPRVRPTTARALDDAADAAQAARKAADVAEDVAPKVKNFKGDSVRIPEGHVMSPRDLPMSAKPRVDPGPFTSAQRAEFLKGSSAGTRLSPHHRHQIPTSHGGVIDELPGPGHPSGNIHTAGSPSRHPGPSVFKALEGGEALRKAEIKAHWQAKGQRLIEVEPGVWVDSGF